MEETLKEKSYRLKQNAIDRITDAINTELKFIAKELGIKESDLSLHYNEEITKINKEDGDNISFRSQIIDIKIHL